MSDISVFILTVIIQHSTSNAGHQAGVDQVMIHWRNISLNPRLYGLHCCQEGNNCWMYSQVNQVTFIWQYIANILGFCLWSRCWLLILSIIVVSHIKYSENKYFPNPSLTSLAIFFTQIFFPGVLLPPVLKLVSSLIMSAICKQWRRWWRWRQQWQQRR